MIQVLSLIGDSKLTRERTLISAIIRIILHNRFADMIHMIGEIYLLRILHIEEILLVCTRLNKILFTCSRYNHREYKGAMTWIEPEDGHLHHFTELHLKGAARLAFMDSAGQGSITADNFFGQPDAYLFVGVGQKFKIVKTDADLSFNIRAYEDATLQLPFKLYVHGVSVHMENNTKVRQSLKYL